MTTLERTINRLDDMMNPIVVRELRQAMEGKFIPAVLIILMVGQLFVLGVYVLAQEVERPGMEAGRDVFLILLIVLLAIALLFIPTYTSQRMATERNDPGGADLMYVTTLKPRKVVSGKFLSAMVLTVLLFSACLPFMTLTYLLRGIDLPSVFLLVTMNLVIVGAAVMFGILLAATPVTRPVQNLLTLILLGVLIYLLVISGGIATDVLRSGMGSISIAWVGMVLIGPLGAFGLMYALAVAMVSPPSANRGLIVRGYVTLAWLVSGAITGCYAAWEGDFLPMWWWMALHFIVIGLMVLGGVSERENLGTRVRKQIPRLWPVRAIVLPFYSGAASALVWCLGIFAATALVAATVTSVTGAQVRGFSQSEQLEMIVRCLGVAAYVFAYGFTAWIIRRAALRNWLDPVHTWALALLLMAGGSVLPVLVTFFINPRDWLDMKETWMILNPFAPVSNENYREFLWLASIWAGATGLACLPWMIRQILAFRPHDGNRWPAADVSEAREHSVEDKVVEPAHE